MDPMTAMALATGGSAVLGAGASLLGGGADEGVNIGEKQWDATRGYIKGGMVPTWMGGQGQGQPAGPGSGGQVLGGANGVGYREIPYVSPWAMPPRYGHEMDNVWSPQSTPYGAPQPQNMGLMDPNVAPSQAANVYQRATLNSLVPGWQGWGGAQANNTPAPQVAPQVAAPQAPTPQVEAPQQAAPLPGLTAYANSSKPDWMSERDWRHFDRLASMRNG